MLRKIPFIAIAVPSLEKAMPFYSQMLGLPTPQIRELPAEKAFEATFQLENIQLKLLAPSSDTSPLAHAIVENGGNSLLHHIAFECDNLADQLKRIESAGGKVISGIGVGFVHPETSRGVLVQIVEKNK